MNIHFKTHFPWNGPDGKPEPTNFHAQLLAAHGLGDGPKKLHTIRRVNGKPRYREGMKLVLCMGSRFKPEPFLETVCTGTQLIEMHLVRLDYDLVLRTRMQHSNDKRYMTPQQMAVLASYDGLSWEQFEKWFSMDLLMRGNGTYQIVHWSDLRY